MTYYSLLIQPTVTVDNEEISPRVDVSGVFYSMYCTGYFSYAEISLITNLLSVIRSASNTFSILGSPLHTLAKISEGGRDERQGEPFIMC